MKKYLFMSILLLAGSGVAAQTVRNVVFILIDDLGVRDLGCYGSDYYETTNCDRLASEGMRFTAAYAAHAVCSPTRAAILTGRYPARLHLSAYIPGQECPNAKMKAPQDWIKYLRFSETTYAEAFRNAGYATCHIGKWHVSPVFGPEKHGFKTVTPWMKDHSQAGDDPWFVRYYTEAAEHFMEANKERPFLLTLSHGTVHVPLYETKERIDKYRAKKTGATGQNNPTYAAMVERMDWSVGRVLAKLKELGIEDETAVVFTSDNGGLMKVFDKEQNKTVTATSNLPYRGGKSQMYEGGIRIPLIVRWPGVAAPGSECDTPVISTDLYPTFLQMAGLPLMPGQHLDGCSLAPLLTGTGGLKRNALYWHYPHYQTIPPHGAIRWNDWKLIEHYEDGRIELFNLAEDLSESKNLAAVFPERAQQLRGWLHDHLEAIGAQMPVPNPNHNPDVYWRKGSFNAPFDSWERKQDQDLRKYVTDPAVNYGAVKE